MNPLIKAVLLGVIRSGVLALGGWIVSHGYATNDTAAQITGSLLALAAAGFSVVDKFVVDHKISTANFLPSKEKNMGG